MSITTSIYPSHSEPISNKFILTSFIILCVSATISLASSIFLVSVNPYDTIFIIEFVSSEGTRVLVTMAVAVPQFLSWILQIIIFTILSILCIKFFIKSKKIPKKNQKKIKRIFLIILSIYFMINALLIIIFSVNYLLVLHPSLDYTKWMLAELLSEILYTVNLFTILGILITFCLIDSKINRSITSERRLMIFITIFISILILHTLIFKIVNLALTPKIECFSYHFILFLCFALLSFGYFDYSRSKNILPKNVTNL